MYSLHAYIIYEYPIDDGRKEYTIEFDSKVQVRSNILMIDVLEGNRYVVCGRPMSVITRN